MRCRTGPDARTRVVAGALSVSPAETARDGVRPQVEGCRTGRRAFRSIRLLRLDLLGNNDLPEVVDHLVEGVDQRLGPQLERILQKRFVHQGENIDEETGQLSARDRLVSAYKPSVDPRPVSTSM